MARLGDICTIYSGTGFPVQYQGTAEGQYPFYKVGDIAKNVTAGNKYLVFCENYVEADIVKIIKGTVLPSRTVVFAKIGEAVKLNRRAITSCECLIDNNAMGIAPNESVLTLDYFFHYMCSLRLETLAEATTVPSVKKSLIEKLDIPLPSLLEQEKISTMLNKVSELIALRREQLAKLDQLVKSRFIELFGDPEDSTTKWERTTFSSVCIDMHQGINTVADKVEYVNSGFPIIQSKNITSGYLDLEDVRYVTESDYEYYRNKYNPKPSDLLVCNIGTIGKSLIVENEVNFLIAWNLFLIKLNKELVSPIFVKVFIELLNQQNYFEKYMTGGTVKFVNKKTMGNISTPLPPMALQEQFATFVEQTDKSKLAIQQSLGKLETLKKSLMQEYFG